MFFNRMILRTVSLESKTMCIVSECSEQTEFLRQTVAFGQASVLFPSLNIFVSCLVALTETHCATIWQSENFIVVSLHVIKKELWCICLSKEHCGFWLLR